MIQWMALSEEEQEEDLDEMVDYDEFGDEEYEEELFNEVDGLVEESNVELKVGDRVVGTVYEIDEDGAYVEIGQKCSGFVPLSECSFARLKTVSPSGCLGESALSYTARVKIASERRRLACPACMGAYLPGMLCCHQGPPHATASHCHSSHLGDWSLTIPSCATTSCVCATAPGGATRGHEARVHGGGG